MSSADATTYVQDLGQDACVAELADFSDSVPLRADPIRHRPGRSPVSGVTRLTSDHVDTDTSHAVRSGRVRLLAG
ncbi:hypothetical protein OIA45_00850 [Streptomyces chartreusis]|uniref:hypothetical protein n=1 Tax=Streptomyces chartreusis TaxID=1969 RepID=UPI00386EE251|nr:hypothetical protein OIA45_00850 [Streptomyces chartreusis]